MRKEKRPDRAPDVHRFHAPPDTPFDVVNMYGTYNVQRTADTDNVFPLIAPGLPRAWGEMRLEKADLEKRE